MIGHILGRTEEFEHAAMDICLDFSLSQKLFQTQKCTSNINVLINAQSLRPGVVHRGAAVLWPGQLLLPVRPGPPRPLHR